MLKDIPARLARIQAYDLGFLRRPFTARHPEHAHSFDVCAYELKRLLSVMLYATDKVEVTSLAVDALLGEFIREDAAYRGFCEAVYGRYLERVRAPAEYEPGGKYARNFYRLYAELYTEVPEIWYEDTPELVR